MPHRRAVSRLGLAGTIILSLILLLAFAAPAMAFPDVPAGHAYEEAINDLSYLGIIGGYSNGNFGLNDPVKRAQFAKMIVGTLEITPNASTATRFTDLGTSDANGYPHKYVQTAYDNGITNGTNAAQTLFDPWKSIRRDQVVSMIVRGANNLYPGALDTPPAGTLSLFDGVAEPHGQNLRIAEYNGILDGLIGMGPGWGITATATRGEVAQMLWNLLFLLDGGGPPPPSGDIWVYVDGSGDYPTIPAAVADVAAGTTIHLGPGVFQLSDTLGITKSLELVGSGMEASGGTTILAATDVIGVGPVTFAARDIRFVNSSTSVDLDVMFVEDGDVTLESCYFTGGNHTSIYGSGLYLYGTATAYVTDCVFTQNELCGIELWDEAYVSAYNCLISDNGDNGVGFFENSSGIVDNCECTYNDLHGVSVNDEADVTIQNSWCSNNGYTGVYASGIYFEENATGDVYNCECNYNWIDGVSLHDYAQVVIEYVTCNYNGEDGISFTESSSGAIRHCECSYSATYDGIDIHDNADAVVENNLCAYNEESGIWFGDYATGSASNNECAGNYWGLYVDATSYPTIYTNNYFHDNVIDYYFE